jgi:uncharacterized protein (DUF1697 family)
MTSKFYLMITYIAFLRGINVGGHHKVPMAELRAALETLKCENIVTFLNSGNIIFNSAIADIHHLETSISTHLEEVFGFPVPTILRNSKTIVGLIQHDPFKDLELTKDRRFYVSFLQNDPQIGMGLPWESEDRSFKIIEIRDYTIFSLLDLSLGKTPIAMGSLERMFGKNLTTRNWNTIKRIRKKLEERL